MAESFVILHREHLEQLTGSKTSFPCIITVMDMFRSSLPPGSNLQHVPVAAWQRLAFNQSMNWTNRRTPLPLLVAAPSFVFPGVSALENTLVFELPAEINVPGRMLLFNAIREIMSHYWDLFVDFIQRLISGGLS